jgi:hypothetical protein
MFLAKKIFRQVIFLMKKFSCLKIDLFSEGVIFRQKKFSSKFFFQDIYPSNKFLFQDFCWSEILTNKVLDEKIIF